MNKIGGARVLAAGLFVVAGAGLAERVVDPFDRHGHDFTIEGPQGYSEIAYASVNWYSQAGEKHDDRFGDLLLLTDAVTALGYVGLRLAETRH